MRILAFKTDLGDKGRLFKIHQFLPSMEMEVAVVVIIQKIPEKTKGAKVQISRGMGRDFVITSVPVKRRAPERMHPRIGPIMVLVT